MHIIESESARQAARILLVEDEALIRMALAEDLRAAGFSVIEAANAQEALDCLRAGAQVDLVLSDIQMPGGVDGLGLARRCRRDYPTLPVILTSGGVRPQQLDGASLFLPKPYGTRVAIQAINKALRLDAGLEAGCRRLAS